MFSTVKRGFIRQKKKLIMSLIKLINKRTAVVIELKPMVGEQLGILEEELASSFWRSTCK